MKLASVITTLLLVAAGPAAARNDTTTPKPSHHLYIYEAVREKSPVTGLFLTEAPLGQYPTVRACPPVATIVDLDHSGAGFPQNSTTWAMVTGALAKPEMMVLNFAGKDMVIVPDKDGGEYEIVADKAAPEGGQCLHAGKDVKHVSCNAAGGVISAVLAYNCTYSVGK